MYVCWNPYAQQPTYVLPPQPSPLTSSVAATTPTPTPQDLFVSLPAQQPVVAPVTVSRKRGSEELMSHSPMVTNGSTMSPQHGQNLELSNEAKKVKLSEQTVNGTSRVVHLRSLPVDSIETEIVQLGMPFGKMTNVLLLKQKSQAFLEFSDEQSASNMVSYYQNCTAHIRAKPCYVQFSNHKELKTDASHALQNATAQAALQAAQVGVMGSPGSSSTDDQTTILRVIVDNVLYPVTLDVLYQLFQRFGKVLKIITFTKNNTFQALIQFSDSISANTAKVTLDGQNIYNGCNTLKIDYSKLTNLNVKYNNDKSRDFTRPDLPSGEHGFEQPFHLSGIPGLLTSSAMPGFGPAHLHALTATAPQTGAHHAFGGLPGTPMPMPGYGASLGGGFGIPSSAALNVARLGLPLTAQVGSSVILVSNLDEQMVTPDALFTLFGVYGDVHRVKILFNKKDNALIQMADPHQAQLAITYLDKVKVWGKPIRVAQSKHSLVQMPKEGQPDAGLTKDFTTSPLHRFKRPGSKNCQNIFPPSSVLHLSNIPPNVSEEEITELFAKQGTVKAFKFFPKDRKMALIQMSTLDEAVNALIAAHNYQLGENSHLRVSFSKSTI